MHESFNKDDPTDFTRKWFAWANGLFGELLLQLVEQRPHLVLKDGPLVLAQAKKVVRTPISLLAQRQALAHDH
jgi:hypothetical protein